MYFIVHICAHTCPRHSPIVRSRRAVRIAYGENRKTRMHRKKTWIIKDLCQLSQREQIRSNPKRKLLDITIETEIIYSRGILCRRPNNNTVKVRLGRDLKFKTCPQPHFSPLRCNFPSPSWLPAINISVAPCCLKSNLGSERLLPNQFASS